MKTSLLFKFVYSCIAIGLLNSSLQAASFSNDKVGYVPTKENQVSREAFRNDRFGIFIVCWHRVNGL